MGGGIAIGKARIVRAGLVAVPHYVLAPQHRDSEVKRLFAAIDSARDELREVGAHLKLDAPPEAKALLEVHEVMLNDPALGFGAQERILDEGLNAQWAWSVQIDTLVQQFGSLDDAYLRERARDVEQIGQRVQLRLSQSPSDSIQSSVDQEIIVAHDLDPADLLKWKSAAGFVLGSGGVNSHTAIIARSLQKPTAMGLGRVAEQIEGGQLLIIDGDVGAVIVAPSVEVLEAYRLKQTAHQLHVARRRMLIGVESKTKSQVSIHLYANIEQPQEAQVANEFGAEGIGLFRSEFLFLDRIALPQEDEQYEAYVQVLEQMKGKSVTIRTIDVGADKALPQQQIDPPANPALGERAIRFSLHHPEIFMTQLRALLRASAHGELRILIPMMAHRFEVAATKELLAHAREQLVREKKAMAAHVPLGAMIEVPAAAIEADWFANELDFLSIGTNDLVQYTLAVDRTDHQVARLYDSHHPAVLSLINNTIQACARHHKPLAVCGEMAGDPDSAEKLIQMGLRQLSMQPQALLAVKERVLMMP